MAKLLEITQLGDPILRTKAEHVDDIQDNLIQRLIDDLIYTVGVVNGVGIAAPQLSESLRIFIMASHPNPRYPEAPLMDPIAIINPGIISYSDDINKDWEGCLSIPGMRGLVPRSNTIFVEYITREGKKEERMYEDFLARIFQHEFDHLNGMVFLDRIDSVKNLITDQEYFKLIS
ncbi:peptide deformylase [Desulfobacterota bacterium AH_259_B03_O07]|nr:peptide deformylase [Desulfobacterota bacterium AH_259_B03_O07]